MDCGGNKRKGFGGFREVKWGLTPYALRPIRALGRELKHGQIFPKWNAESFPAAGRVGSLTGQGCGIPLCDTAECEDSADENSSDEIPLTQGLLRLSYFPFQ